MNEKNISDELLKILACPKDKAAVEKTDDGNLKCANCGRIYPVIDGIPLMLLEEEMENEEKKR